MKKIFYRVKSGDTLLSVCEFFSLSIASVIKDNMLESDIEEGDILVITKEENLYTVKPLETFYSVSKKVGASEEELRRLNPIPYLFYGLKIKIK